VHHNYVHFALKTPKKTAKKLQSQSHFALPPIFSIKESTSILVQNSKILFFLLKLIVEKYFLLQKKKKKKNYDPMSKQCGAPVARPARARADLFKIRKSIL
jgi:hypothetical protein